MPSPVMCLSLVGATLPEVRILGPWTTGIGQSEFGPLSLDYTFYANGTVVYRGTGYIGVLRGGIVRYIPDPTGKPKDESYSYRLEGDKITIPGHLAKPE